MDADKIKAYLEAIKANESSGGKNTKHKTISSGVSKGDKAVGKYGITPNTAKEMMNRYPELDQEGLKALPNSDLAAKLSADEKTPDALRARGPASLDDQIAEKLAEHNLDKYPDVPSALAAWNAGHNLPTSKLHKLLNTDSYAKEYADKAMPVYEGNVMPKSQFTKIEDLLNPVLPSPQKQEDEDDEWNSYSDDED